MSKPTKSIVASGWNCSTCTFYHHAPAARCAMCQEPRVTKAQMSDFIRGKPIPDDTAASPTRKPAPTAQRTLAGNHSLKVPPTKRPRHNPYKKKVPPSVDSSSTAAPLTFHNNPLPPSAHTSISHNQPIRTAAQTTTSHNQQPKTIHSYQKPFQQRTVVGQPARQTSNKPPLRPIARSVPYNPGPVPVDPSAAKDWIYPNDPNYPKRNYQFCMAQTALFHNTLVSLPTGLGKTLIAAVVLYNYYRWFPTGKVIFMAPTLPLVSQQVKVRALSS